MQYAAVTTTNNTRSTAGGGSGNRHGRVSFILIFKNNFILSFFLNRDINNNLVNREKSKKNNISLMNFSFSRS